MTTYILPRAALVIVLWGMTCALIKNLWPAAADPVILAIVALAWACTGTVYFAYLRKLKHDIEVLERNHRMRMARRPA
jgi:hypothetical protein